MGHSLTDQARHFSPRRKYRTEVNWTWRMWRERITISGQGEYILGMTQQNFYMVGLQEPRTLTDHRMVLGVICGYGVTRHCTYVKGQTTWPIREEKERTRQTDGALHFRDLKRKINKLSRMDRSTSELWISDTTWNIADQRTALGRKSTTNQV